MSNEYLKQKERKARVSYSRFIYGLVFIPLIVLAFKKAIAPVPAKTYTVTKQWGEWIADFDTFSEIQSKIGYQTDKPYGDYYQAAMARLIKRNYDQLIRELQEEQKKSADSTKRKP